MIAAGASNVGRRESLLPRRVGFSWRETATTLSAWIRFRESLSQKTEPVGDRFSRLAEQWKSGIGALSDPQDVRALPGFSELVRLGPEIIPIILKELDREPTYWFEVLTAIAGEDPTPDEHAGDVDEMIRAWKSWAAEKKLA